MSNCTVRPVPAVPLCRPQPQSTEHHCSPTMQVTLWSCESYWTFLWAAIATSYLLNIISPSGWEAYAMPDQDATTVTQKPVDMFFSHFSVPVRPVWFQGYLSYLPVTTDWHVPDCPILPTIRRACQVVQLHADRHAGDNCEWAFFKWERHLQTVSLHTTPVCIHQQDGPLFLDDLAMSTYSFLLT